MGWFSGYAEDLMPLPRHFKATKYMGLMGGVDKVLDAANEAVEKEEAKHMVRKQNFWCKPKNGISISYLYPMRYEY